MSGLASDEVAEDYKSSLEDLTTNDRFQISNLTVIAKESTEHAIAISRVLENHIRTTPPFQKLPALYVVDSVVKNVGTPYTSILGRNLYQTFMNAYTLVDSQTRRKLDEMLKTWKEPVPGSLDNRPVFPVEITRNIENALIKARTAALQQHQNMMRHDMARRDHRGSSVSASQLTPPIHGGHPGGPSTPVPQWRTATPPQAFPPQNYYNLQQPGSARNTPPPVLPGPVASTPLPVLPTSAPAPAPASVPAPMTTPAAMPLTSYAQAPISTPPVDNPLLASIRAALVPGSQASLGLTTPVSSVPMMAPHPISQQPPQPAQPPPATLATPSSTPAVPPAAGSLIASLRAAGLLPPAAATPGMSSATPNTGTNTAPAAAPAAAPNPLNLPLIIPQSSSKSGSTSGPSTVARDLLTPFSMKRPRAEIVARLYTSKPNRCGTCGRRFTANADGNTKKTQHMDWHFQTNQRLTESLRRGQSRSWWLDEVDWIKARDFDDDNSGGGDGDGASGAMAGPSTADVSAAPRDLHTIISSLRSAQQGSTSTGATIATATAGVDGMGPDRGKDAGNDRSSNAGILGAGNRKLLSKMNNISSASIPTPSDPKLRNAPCPICLEKFESTWAEADQDWIWRDARIVGNRVFHASCYAEVHEGNYRESGMELGLEGKKNAGSGEEEDRREESARKKRKRVEEGEEQQQQKQKQKELDNR